MAAKKAVSVAKKPASAKAAPKAKAAASKAAAPKATGLKAKPVKKTAPAKTRAPAKAPTKAKAPARARTSARAKPATKARAAAVTARQKAAAAKQIADRKHVAAMLKLVTSSLEDDKAENIIAIDLSGKTPMADYMVVASGRSGRHVAAVADHLMRRLKTEGFGLARVEGMTQGDWVLIDAGDIIIHVFRPEVREFYRLEKMWAADISDDQPAA